MHAHTSHLSYLLLHLFTEKLSATAMAQRKVDNAHPMVSTHISLNQLKLLAVKDTTHIKINYKNKKLNKR